MKLSTISTQSNPLIDRSRIDIDVTSRLGPAIQQHLSGLEELCKILPNCADLQEKLNELKALFSSVVTLSTNVLEADNTAPRVYNYDESKPFSQQMVRTGAGAERIGYLPTKIINEAGRVESLVKDVDVIERMSRENKGMQADDVQDSIDKLLHFNKQLINSVQVFNEAVTEMKTMLGPKTEIGEGSTLLDNSVTKLENRLHTMVKNGSTLDYKAIDEIMQQICREDGCAPSDLHNHFSEKNNGSPDAWVRNLEEGLMSVIKEAHVMELYQTMKIGLGEKAWVAISKRLRAQGMEPKIIEQIINRAVINSQSL